MRLSRSWHREVGRALTTNGPTSLPDSGSSPCDPPLICPSTRPSFSFVSIITPSTITTIHHTFPTNPSHQSLLTNNVSQLYVSSNFYQQFSNSQIATRRRSYPTSSRLKRASKAPKRAPVTNNIHLRPSPSQAFGYCHRCRLQPCHLSCCDGTSLRRDLPQGPSCKQL
jgi:hypothetical protein